MAKKKTITKNSQVKLKMRFEVAMKKDLNTPLPTAKKVKKVKKIIIP